LLSRIGVFLLNTLQRGWSDKLAQLVSSTKSELIISSPFVSETGVRFIIDNLTDEFKNKGLIRFVTNLSRNNMRQGVTNPSAFRKLFENVRLVQMFHLPRLHAKVYIRDNVEAIVTSGNLTNNGLFSNFEYGVCVNDRNEVSTIKNDITDYSNIGTLLNLEDIITYGKLFDKVEQLRNAHEKQYVSNQQLVHAINQADDELIKLKLADGKIHPIFEQTILYLLKKYGALEQTAINKLIKDIHPELCGNENRIINGVTFGKKWKHIARTSMQNLVRKNLVQHTDEKWDIKQKRI
jgi:phosphatidylserine/phosphatidylglycerophosphate/cardiolipin synthase-like enzyme